VATHYAQKTKNYAASVKIRIVVDYHPAILSRMLRIVHGVIQAQPHCLAEDDLKATPKLLLVAVGEVKKVRQLVEIDKNQRIHIEEFPRGFVPQAQFDLIALAKDIRCIRGAAGRVLLENIAIVVFGHKLDITF
jgi:hypothetical protein